PASTAQNTVAPTAAGVVGLTVKETSNASSADIADFQSANGSTTYLSVGATGTVTVSTLSSTGVVHNNASGVLSTSLIANADLTAGTYSNVTGTGTLTAGALGAGFSTVNVAQGGTGVNTFANTYGLLTAGTTSTGAIQNVGTGTSGQVLISNGAGALPSWS